MTERRSRITRRQFIRRGAAAAVAAPLVVPRSVLGGAERTAPSERITVGFIGCGKMANDYHLSTLLRLGDDEEANGWLDRQRRDPWQLPVI